MKRLFRRVCIIGVGLIGGSLAKSIKRSGMADEVVGYFRKESSAEFARKNRILDKYYLNMESALKDSDL
ncbi:MAG: prephenate dehydrogenase/arogenate dehydrogenase family protein, partial [Candidatus Omnitrophica bacterium]|nr:prephenate dehydrogenase/arogenate dehydrogenase family protein [Candidatus Omnitrophota bacterium]